MIGDALIWRRIPTWGIMALITVLLFVRLDDRLLWGDEAETALLARSILQTGLPRIDVDGNVVTLNGTAVDANSDRIWTWSPWLDEYLVALSFLILGESTWSARFPCALIGLICVPLLGGWFWRRYRNVQVVWMGMLGLAVLEAFLLHARQARYYTIIVLGQILLLHGLLDFWEHRPRGKWVVAAAFLMQFYCNYIVSVANVLALVPMVLWCRRRMRFLDFVVSMALAGLGALPWVIYVRPWHQSEHLMNDAYWPKAGFYLQEIHFHILPLFFLLWPLLRWSGHRKVRHEQQTHLMESPTGRAGAPAAVSAPTVFPDELLTGFLFFFGAYVLIPPLAPGQFVRYLLPLFPMGVVWLVECLWSLRSRSWRKWALFLALISTNIPAWISAAPFRHDHPLRIELADFVDELLHHYTNRAAVMIEWFNAHARPGDAVGINDPEFPLAFHTKLRIIDSRYADDAAKKVVPDWVMFETACGIAEPSDIPPPAWLPGYEPVTVRVPDTRRVGCLPEADIREYRTARRMTDLHFFRRLR